jgi:aspartyl-tRNA(Asn)/glutamyl-tRNA(Gln) amidotransferase subunit A
MKTVAQLSGLLRKGKADPVELVEGVLDAIASHGDQALFIDVLAARARKEARAARKRFRSGVALSALDGIPLGWKDLFDVKGRVTTAGSLVLKSDPPAAHDAALLQVAANAGAVTVGTLNMTEFAYSGIGLNPHYGTPRNPRDPSVHRVPGGSSSASGAVVAAGLLPAAIGTDTGGSVRIPASFNGIVGYKSSTGHYPMEGVFPLSRTLDTLGPLANTAEDCAIIDAVLCGRKKAVAAAPSLKGMEFAIPTNVVFESAEAEVLANFEHSLKQLASAGARIKRKAIPVFNAIQALNASRGHILGIEALHLHWERVHGPDAGRIDQRVVQRIMLSEKMLAIDLVEVLQQRRKLIAEFNALTGGAMVLFPTTPTVAMPVAPLEADHSEFFRANAKTLRNTTIGNFLDWCGVSLPNGAGQGGMPTGLLISASHGRDAEILAVAQRVQLVIGG